MHKPSHGYGPHQHFHEFRCIGRISHDRRLQFSFAAIQGQYRNLMFLFRDLRTGTAGTRTHPRHIPFDKQWYILNFR